VELNAESAAVDLRRAHFDQLDEALVEPGLAGRLAELAQRRGDGWRPGDEVFVSDA